MAITHALRGAAILAAAASALFAQDGVRTEPPGLEASWEMVPVLKEISAHATRLKPVLDKIDVDTWVKQGASDTYAAQLQSSKDQADALAREATALARNPEQLSAELEVLFRIQGLERMVDSLVEGLRKYQNPAFAQALAAQSAENGASRERLQRYVVNLAAQRERDYKVMDEEAQRCRAALTTMPPKSPRKK